MFDTRMAKTATVASREFVRGAARMNDLMYIISKSKALIEKDIAHSSMIAIDAGNWSDGVDTTWNATAIVVSRGRSRRAREVTVADH